jgi:hypothetical protein
LEPANGGFAVVKPNATVYQDMQRIIEEQGNKLGIIELFDPTIGWGHKIEPPDNWETNGWRNGT